MSDADYLLKEGLIIDGSKGATPQRGDIAVKADRIVAVGDLSGVRAGREISIMGLVACPGFIDAHAHSEFTLLADGRAEGKICQGITTEINGNCGMSAAPLFGAALEQRSSDLDELGIKERWNSFGEYFQLLSKKGTGVNFVTLVGHGNIRASVTGYEDRRPSQAEMYEMKALLAHAMREGARGLSSGLIYPPGVYSETDELTELAAEAAAHRGIYTTHMRSEGDRLLESIEEVIKIARGSGIPVHISHLKTSDKKNWGKLDRALQIISEAQREGLSVSCDRYPYIASSTDLDALLPPWTFEGGNKKELERIEHEQPRIVSSMLETHPEMSSPEFWRTILVSSVSSSKNKWMEGETVDHISSKMNKSPISCVLNLLGEERLQVGAIFFFMNESNLETILRQDYTMIGTDSSARSYDGITASGKPHPRGFGSCARVLGTYVRDRMILPPGDAVYKMTGLPARVFRLEHRGRIAEGYFADITVFDPGSIRDRADFTHPFSKPEGIRHVLVNGVPVLLDGRATGAKPGRIIT